MERSDRDLERALNKVDPEPGEVDTVEMWEAFITGTHPEEMDTPAEQQAVRKLWTRATDVVEVEPGEVEDMTAAQIEELDEEIRWYEGPSGDGRPF